jgi:hypothetical protein
MKKVVDYSVDDCSALCWALARSFLYCLSMPLRSNKYMFASHRLGL